MKFSLLLLALCATVTSALPRLHSKVIAPKAMVQANVQPSAESALSLRGGFIEAELYKKIVCGAFGLYALQFLVTPEKLVTDHFDTAVSPSFKFWVRGTAIPTAVAVYALMNLEGDAATKGCLALSAGCGLLYPWNAKFNLIGEGGGAPLKYPMHYVPEVLMAVLTVLGVGILAKN